jgi:hypothetical protein
MNDPHSRAEVFEAAAALARTLRDAGMGSGWQPLETSSWPAWKRAGCSRVLT